MLVHENGNSPFGLHGRIPILYRISRDSKTGNHDYGTSLERIGDESMTPAVSAFVPPNMWDPAHHLRQDDDSAIDDASKRLAQTEMET